MVSNACSACYAVGIQVRDKISMKKIIIHVQLIFIVRLHIILGIIVNTKTNKNVVVPNCSKGKKEPQHYIFTHIF